MEQPLINMQESALLRFINKHETTLTSRVFCFSISCLILALVIGLVFLLLETCKIENLNAYINNNKWNIIKMLLIDISCVVVAILPTVHLLTIKINYEPHMLHMVKFGFIVNTVILTVITSLLQHILEFEFHESYPLSINAENKLGGWPCHLLTYSYTGASSFCC